MISADIPGFRAAYKPVLILFKKDRKSQNSNRIFQLFFFEFSGSEGLVFCQRVLLDSSAFFPIVFSGKGVGDLTVEMI
ncbi:MAG: hypothetical protein PVH85_30825 [Desulfobacterales bacterium]|jgi:hypothetical protein